MPLTLSDVEIRVVAVLLEKEKTTPEYYPLTLNALTNACNQKSSREPVMNLDQTVVIRALYSLKDKNFVLEKHEENSRVAKYAHRFDNIMSATEQEKAVLCILMLRGPQTAGEIKIRSERLANFVSPAEVETILQALSVRADGPYVERLAKQPGQKECRFRHLFSPYEIGKKEISEESNLQPSTSNGVVPDDKYQQLEKRITDLEAQVFELKTLIQKQ